MYKVSWGDSHISQTHFRLSKGIGILYKLRQYVSQSALRSLYFAFVHSNISYCLLNWGNAAPSNLTPIKRSLNKAPQDYVLQRAYVSCKHTV